MELIITAPCISRLLSGLTLHYADRRDQLGQSAPMELFLPLLVHPLQVLPTPPQWRCIILCPCDQVSAQLYSLLSNQLPFPDLKP